MKIARQMLVIWIFDRCFLPYSLPFLPVTLLQMSCRGKVKVLVSLGLA